MILGKGFEIFDHFLFGLGRGGDVEYMLASRAPDLDTFGRYARIV
jgi:hypothetical protein